MRQERYTKHCIQNTKTEIEPLAKQVCEAGGLFIVGTERHESRRIDNQLRGRSGRQGDPGESRFFLALDDDLMRLFGSERVASVVDRLGLDDDTPLKQKYFQTRLKSSETDRGKQFPTP